MRTLSSGAQAALASPAFAAALLVEMLFEVPLRVCTSEVDVEWNGFTWLGAGQVGQVGDVKDSSGASEGLSFSLSAVPSSNIALALEESVRNIQCRLYFAILNGQTHAVEDAPLVWAGLLDQMTITEAGDSASVDVSAKHLGNLFARPKPLKYTASDQQKVSPGDTSLRFIPSQNVHKDIWPAASWGKQ